MRGAGLLLGLAACFSPAAPAGVPCADDFTCPDGQRCNRDVSPPTCGVETPVPIDAAMTIDAPVPLGPWSDPVMVMMPLGEEDDPTLTGDMLEMYFNRNGTETWRVTRATVSAPWGVAVPATELDPATTPEISRDGLTMYIGSERLGGLGANDIWMSTRPTRQSVWSSPVHVPDLSSALLDTNATIADNGKDLVLARRTDAVTRTDVYLATRQNPNSPWSTTQLAQLTSEDADGDGMLSSDGLELYFYSTRTRMGDLYVSRRANQNSPFEAPVAIDELNADGVDQDPWISPDGRHLFFASDRSGTLAIYESTR